MSNRTWTDNDLIEVLLKARTYADVLRSLGLSPRGGNYLSIKNKIKELELDTSHLVGQAHMKGRKVVNTNARPLDQLLQNGIFSQGSRLRKRLVKEGIWERICFRCKNIEWQGVPISLELHHKNGDRMDNRLENLDQLCPNCHAMTKTYRGRNSKEKIREKPREKPKCLDCGKPVRRENSKCKRCAMLAIPVEIRRKVPNRPDLQTLLTSVSECGNKKTGMKYGVSGASIRKWIKEYQRSV